MNTKVSFGLDYLNIMANADVGSTAWQPPFLYGIDPDSFSTLMSLGMLLLIPDLIKAYKGMMGVKDSPVRFGLGTFFGGVSGAGGTGMEYLGKFGSLSLGLDHIKRGPLGKLLPGGKGGGH